MSEQIKLFDTISESTIESELNDIVEQAREKYDYFKMHKSGMYELIKSSSDKDLYDILKLRKAKDGSIGFYFDNQLYIKFLVKKEQINITKELHSELLRDKPAAELTANDVPKCGISVELPYNDEASFFKAAIDYLVKTKKPAYKFSCCSQYKECSQEKRCLHENQFYAKGCFYRENLEKGLIFYGKNANQ